MSVMEWELPERQRGFGGFVGRLMGLDFGAGPHHRQGEQYRYAPPTEVLRAVAIVLGELVAIAEGTALAGDPLVLPAPLGSPATLGALQRVQAALGRTAGHRPVVDSSDVAVLRQAARAARQVLLTPPRRRTSPESEVASEIEDCARVAAASVWPGGRHEKAVALSLFGRLSAILDGLAEPRRVLFPRLPETVVWAATKAGLSLAPPNWRTSMLQAAAVVGTSALYVSAPCL